MADNLTIQTGVDNSQLRADLAVAQAEIRKFSADLRKSANESLKSGDTTGLAEIAGHVEQATQRASGLRAALASTNGEARTFAQSLREAAEHAERARGTFGGGIEGFVANVPVTPVALGIAAAVAAIGEIVHLGLEAAETGHNIEAVASQLGVSSGEVHQWNIAAGRASVSADDLDRALVRLAASTEKAAEAQRKNILDAAKIGADALGIVARGGHEKAPSSHLVDAGLSPSVALVGDDARKFHEFVLSQYNDLRRVQADAAKVGQQIQLPPIETYEAQRKQLFGEQTKVGEQYRQDFVKFGGQAPVASMSEGLARQEPGFRDAFTKIGVTVINAEGKLREFREIVIGVSDGLKKLDRAAALLWERTELGRGILANPKLGQFVAGGLGDVARTTPEHEDKAVETTAQVKADISSMQAEIAEAKFQIGAALDSGFVDLKEVSHLMDLLAPAEAATAQAQREAEGTVIGFSGLLDRIGSLLSQPAAPAAEASLPDLVGHASGGYISGPGTGRSDSIVARVSNGEYIFSAGATQRLGVGMLNRMNFGRGVPRFESGGLVGSVSSSGAAGGLGTVNIVLQDGSKHGPMQAEQNVFEHLVQHLRTKQRVQIGPRASTATATP